MMHPLRRCSFSIALVLLVMGLLGSVARAQVCNSESGGASGFGFSCTDPLMMDFSGVTESQYYMNEDDYIVALAKSMIVGLGDNSPGLEPLGGSGTVHLASGQFKHGWHARITGGVAANSRITIGAKFHSYHVEPGDGSPGNGSVDELEDPTSPFGAGWMPSWFQGLTGTIQIPLAGAQPDITWVDSEGVEHVADFDQGYGTFTQTAPLGGQTGTSFAYYVWKATKNARLVYDAARGVFYREYANRVCVEFTPCTFGSPGTLSYWPSRIYRGEYPATPDWSIQFEYAKSTAQVQHPLNPSYDDRLVKITDARGFEHSLHWGQPSTGSAYRVTKISVSHPTIPAPSGGWSVYDVDLDYDTNTRLQYVKPPDWEFYYLASGQVDSSAATKKGLGLKFGYDANGLLNDIYRVIKTGTSWTGATEERYLHTTYVTTAGQLWKVASQVENPDGTPTRTTTFAYTATDMTMTDANSVKHKYLRDTNTGQPSSWHVTKYTREANDQSLRSWEYTWSACGCGRLETIKLPTGRILKYGYDSAGRGLLTSITLTDTSGSYGSSSRNWNLTYESWGDPGSTGSDYYTASRLKTFQYYASSGTAATWTATNAWSGSILTINLVSPTGDHTYTAKEDKWKRLTSIEEPSFTGGGGIERVKTLFAYETSTSNGGYGLLKQVTRYPNGSTPVTTVFTRNSLGHVKSIQDEKGGTTDLTLDAMGNVTMILGPITTSGADSASSFRPKTELTRSLFGGVARAKVYAYDEKGAAYPKGTILSESGENVFGELIESRTDGAKLSSSSAVSMLTKRTYDSIGRLIKIELPGGRETRYELDDFDMIEKVKVRPDASTGVGSWPTRTFTYNSEGKHLSSTDATGKLTSYTYDSYGRLATIQRTIDGSNWRKAVMTYNPTGWDSYRYLTKVVYSVSGSGGSATIAERSWTRDTLGRLDETILKSYVNSSMQTKHKYSYNGLSRVSKIEDVTNSRSTTYLYDAGGAIKKVLDNLTNANSIEVDRNIYGEVTDLIRHRVRESAGGSFSTVDYKDKFTYDELGRLKQVQRYGKSSSQLAVRKYGFDSLGNLTWLSSQQDSTGYKITEVDFDALGRTRKTTRNAVGGGNAIITTQEFNDGLGSFSDGNDDFGRTMNQDLVGQIHTRTDARGLSTKYYYDKLGTLIHRRLPGYSSTSQARGWSYIYDAEGRLEEWKDGNSAHVKIRRDGYGRMDLRYAAGGTSHLSTMTTYERFLYSDTTLETTHKTFYGAWLGTSSLDTDTGTLLNQVLVKRDGLGRLDREDYGFLDNGSQLPAFTKSLKHGYGSGSEDTTFRRSLHLLGSDWKFQFTPDAAGKMRTIAIAAPRPGGSGNHTYDHTATYTYEGGRVATRKYGVSSGGNTYNHTMTQQFDDLGYLKSITTDFNINGSGSTQVFSFEQGMDLVGNVKWRKYSKVNGKAGDYYKLDGHNRVEEVKLGVPSGQIGPSTTYGGATTFDEKLTYVLDAANNWDSVQSSINGTNDITIASDTNEYTSVNGSSPLTYDDNGNLVADYYRIFVYDYLDRLCEVHQDPNYSPLMTGGASSSSSRTSSTSTNPQTAPTLAQVDTFLSSNRATDMTTYSVEKGVGAYNTREAKKTTKSSSQTQSATASVPEDYVLIALYGYDPNNRRLYRGLADPSPTGQQWWYTYDGWQQLEEWENYQMLGILVPMKVNFDGIGIDEHLGYAKYNTSTYSWDRYLLTQDTLNTVHSLVDPLTGNAVERYEYDAYGKRSVYRQVSGNWTLMSGTIYMSDYGFTGRRHDAETGFCYYRNRYYWPEIGRFMTSDPIGIWVDAGNFGNGYSYVGARPGTSSDPRGLLSIVSPLDNNGGSGFGDGPVVQTDPLSTATGGAGKKGGEQKQSDVLKCSAVANNKSFPLVVSRDYIVKHLTVTRKLPPRVVAQTGAEGTFTITYDPATRKVTGKINLDEKLSKAAAAGQLILTIPLLIIPLPGSRVAGCAIAIRALVILNIIVFAQADEPIEDEPNEDDVAEAAKIAAAAKAAEKAAKALERDIKAAEAELRKNREFRRWFHQEYKSDQGIPRGDRHNPDLGGRELVEALEEWRSIMGGE